MKDDATIFKELIISKMEPVLIGMGYKKTEEYKGFFEYQSTNNRLVFVYNWSRERTYYCEIRFDGSYESYVLGNVINKMKSVTPKILLIFEKREFIVKINEWVEQILVLLKENDVPNIRFDTPVIQELRTKNDKQNTEYALQRNIDYLKNGADTAWKTKNYKQYISFVSQRIELLPPSYAKKLEIAKKKL